MPKNISGKTAILVISLAALIGLLFGRTGSLPTKADKPQTATTAELFKPEDFKNPENQLLAEIVNRIIQETR